MMIIKAMVIDDDSAVLSILKAVLQRRGYEVHAFGDPIQSPLYNFNGSCCSVNCGCPDLIISDYNMPGINGVELLESAMKNGCHCRHLALITGKGLMVGDLIRVAKYGTRYFTKPLDFDDFYDWLDHVELHARKA